MITNHPSDLRCPLPRRIERVRVSITSPLVQPSPNGRRVGIRIVTFEACSGFTRVTARRIAQPPKVTFVTRLRSRQLPSETARQLPDLSTIIRVEPSSTDDSRLQGALPSSDEYSDARCYYLAVPDGRHARAAAAPPAGHGPGRSLRQRAGDRTRAPRRTRRTSTLGTRPSTTAAHRLRPHASLDDGRAA